MEASRYDVLIYRDFSDGLDGSPPRVGESALDASWTSHVSVVHPDRLQPCLGTRSLHSPRAPVTGVHRVAPVCWSSP